MVDVRDTEILISKKYKFSKENEMKHCECRHTMRTEKERKVLMTRLKTVESDAYCPDIVMQVSAVTNALNSFNKLLLAAHIRGCVTEDIREGKEDKVDELCSMLQKVMK